MEFLTQAYQTLGLGIAMVLLSIATTNFLLFLIWRKLEEIRFECEYNNLEDDLDTTKEILQKL